MERDMEERATTSKDTGALPIMYSDFSTPSDCDQDHSDTTSPTNNVTTPLPIPTTIQELSPSTSSSNESTDDNVPSTSNEPTRMKRKKRKKASRKRARTPDETDEEEHRRLQRNARQRKRRADEKKNNQLTRERLAALENRRTSERVWMRRYLQRLRAGRVAQTDHDPALNPVPSNHGPPGTETHSMASGGETETTGYFTDTNHQNISRNTTPVCPPVCYETAETDYSGYLTDASRDPFLS